MISRNTAAQIAYAYDEIKAAKELMDVIEKGSEHGSVPDFRDAFGRSRGLQLGVLSGNGHRLMDVSYKLAKIIIKAHIREKEAEIEALCVNARQEMDHPAVP